MSWDLFTSAEAARLERTGSGHSPRRAPVGSPMSNEELAFAVAAQRAEGMGAGQGGAAEWSVGQVNAAARELIEGVMPPVWVVGEVANFTRARSGHCYFTLRDADAQLRCVMWRDEARRLPTPPEEGMEVRALGRLTLYQARGEFQLVASELEGRGEGLWKLALERLRARLHAEGLTDAARKRPLPGCPARVGVVTSAQGAALHDIVTVIRRRAPWTRIVLCPCRVQGDGAAAEIAAAVERMGRAACADVLIVGRGGGSVEDLWAFNDEVVVRAIAACPVPTISAVGHETDVSLADLVADHRAPTPSAAAEAAVPDGAALRRALRQADAHIQGALRQRAAAGRARLDVLHGRLGTALARAAQRRRERVGAAAQRLHALSPLAALHRGFALPLDPDGRVLRCAEHFRAGDAFELIVRDGAVPCRVEE